MKWNWSAMTEFFSEFVYVHNYKTTEFFKKSSNSTMKKCFTKWTFKLFSMITCMKKLRDKETKMLNAETVNKIIGENR